MKHSLSHLLTLSLALGLFSFGTGSSAEHSGTPKVPTLIAKAHSLGFRQLGPEDSGKVFKEIWALSSSGQMREGGLDKLAASLAKSFVSKDGQQSNCIRLIRPLLNELLDSECVVEVLEHPQDLLEGTLAVRLDDSRRRVWQANWSQILEGWKPQFGTFTPNISVFSTNQWFAVRVVVGAKQANVSDLPGDSLFTKLRKGQLPAAPRDSWVNVDADLSRWAEWTGRTNGKNLPQLQLTVTGRKEYLRSQGRLTFRQPLESRVEKWDIPTDTIRDPLISFTAVQGFAPWLKRQPLMQELGLNSTPNQLYLWGLSQTAYQIQAAVPVPDAQDAFRRVAEKWVSKFNPTLASYSVGNIVRLNDRPGLVWRGLPLLVPYLDTVKSGGHDYLHGGIFPVSPSTNPAPPQLFQEISGRTNLLYYDWEITQLRLAQLRSVAQLASVFLTISPTSTNSSSFKWLEAIEPRLGNTITEVSMVSPQELRFQRTSHAGLNGLELLTFASWLEGTNFPSAAWGVNFRPVVRADK